MHACVGACVLLFFSFSQLWSCWNLWMKRYFCAFYNLTSIHWFHPQQKILDTVLPKAAVSFNCNLSRMDCYYLPPQLAVWCVCCQHLHSSQSGLFTDKAHPPRRFHGHRDSTAICLGQRWRCLPHLHLHPLQHWCWGLHCVSASQSSPRGDSMPSPFPALCRSELKQAPIWVFVVIHFLQQNLSFLLSDLGMGLRGYALPIGRFSEAGLLEWMRFAIFRARSRKRSQRISGPISE